MSAPVPNPTPIYRFLHIDNLSVVLQRGALHAPNHCPKDGLPYRTIHNLDIQNKRRIELVPCGPGGTIHDYVAFYFGPRSPMLLQLHTGQVSGYNEKQDALIYLGSTAQNVAQNHVPFVFSDGHGIARITKWFDSLTDLEKVDWVAAYATIWKDTINDMDRQRRKQAEFLVHKRCDWSLIQEIAVVNSAAKTKVESIVGQFSTAVCRPVNVRPDWYY